MADDLDLLKDKVVTAHRVLTHTGSMGDITGHVFTRIPGTNEMLARCRSMGDISPGFVGPDALHRIDFSGTPAEEMGDWVPPPERFIGIEIMKARPDVNCVVHSHPPAQILCSVTGVEIRPILGKANSGGSQFVLGGVPVYPRSILVASSEIARGMLATMGNRDVVLLAAHGNVVCGRTVEEATSRAIAIENLAKVCWTIAAARMKAPDISTQDIEENINPQQPAAKFSQERGGPNWMWEYYVQALKENADFHAEMGAWMY
jgi:ribulose-5-phosphate 4-epimerase/fuculose-1-phosphate aldolase